MPDSTMSAMLPAPGVVTDGSKYQMNGSSNKPTKAVNKSNTATLLSLKKRSTRYLSRCTEMAHKTGPEKAKTIQDTWCTCPLVWSAAHGSANGTRKFPHSWTSDRLYGAHGPAQFGLPDQ